MTRQQTVTRLVRRVTRGGRRGRRAARRLDRAFRRAGGPGAAHPARTTAAVGAVVDPVWEQWLERPSDPVWALLARWEQPARWQGRPCSLVALHAAGRDAAALPPLRGADLVEAFTRPDHPVGTAARELLLSTSDSGLVDEVCAAAAAEPAGDLAEFCVEHGLAPADPARRAAFLVLTGQAKQHRAADPDGALLAAAYASADARERAQLRAALVRTGGLDLVRTVADSRPGQFAELSPNEVDHLATRLTYRADWAALWSLVVAVSPVRAGSLVRRFPAGWRPPRERDRHLFAALSGDTAAALRCLSAPYRPAGRRRPGPVYAVSFRADGSAVVAVGTDHSGRTVLAEYTLPGLDPAPPAGDPVVDDALGLLRHGDWTLVGHSVVEVTGRAEVPAIARVDQLVSVPGGFAALDQQSGRLVTRSRTGTATVSASLTGDDLHFSELTALAAEPVTGWFAVAGNSGPNLALVLLDRAGRIVATGATTAWGPTSRIREAAFLDPDRLLTVGLAGEVRQWHREDARLVTAAEPGAYVSRGIGPTGGIVPAVGRVGLRSDYLGWSWFDDHTLTPASDPLRAASDFDYSGAWASPDGEWLASAHDDELRLYRLGCPAWAAALANRPIAAYRPADLAAAPAAERAGTGAGRIVAACLEYRFGPEIRLGAGADAGAGASTVDSDVALARPPGGP